MRIIKTYEDLLAEKEELTAQLSIQKAFIKQDVKAIKEELKPASDIIGLFRKMGTKDKSNPAVVFGVDVATDLFIKNTLLRKGGWLTRLIVPFLVKNLSTHWLTPKTNKPALINGNFFQRLVDKLRPA
jgi:hypothetical protein